MTDAHMNSGKELLEGFRARLDAVGVPAMLLDPSDDDPFQCLVAAFDGIGPSERAVRVQLSFVPIAPDPGQAPTHLLQTFFELSTDLPPSAAPELTRACMMLNPQLPVGALGILDPHGAFFYKQCCLINQGFGLEINLTLIDQQLGLMLHVLNTFIDPLMKIASGQADASELSRHTPA